MKQKKEKKQKKYDILNNNVELTENNDEQTTTNKQCESNFNNSFFYTNDKFINSIDNIEILTAILSKFSNINENSTDSLIKKSIVLLIDDDKFTKLLLKYYNITIFDLFKLLFKLYSSVFKGPYLKKLKNHILLANYDTTGKVDKYY